MIGFRAVPLLLAAALAAVAPPAAASDEGPDFVPTLAKAFTLAKERGNPILVWVVIDDDPSNKADQETLKNKDVQKAMKGFLVVLGNHEDSHGTKDGTIAGKPAKVCALAPTITCADHKRAIDEVYKAYGDVCVDKSSALRAPCHFVVDGDGKLVGTINNGTLAAGFAEVSPPNMVKGLKELLAKSGGPGLSDAQYAEFQKLVAAARTLVENGRMSEAAKTLVPVSSCPKNIAIVVAGRELLARVDREATASFAKAKSMLGDNALAGVAALEKVAADYPGTDSAKSAAKEVEAFRASPEGKKAVKEMAREKEARAELEKALAAAGKDDVKALRSLEALAKKWAGLPAGADAAARAEAIRNDPERMKAVRAAEDDRAAKAALTLAKGMKDGGKKDEAAAKLREIVEKYPGTEAAKEAAKLLEDLR